jgi:hypothetical protein
VGVVHLGRRGERHAVGEEVRVHEAVVRRAEVGDGDVQLVVEVEVGDDDRSICGDAGDGVRDRRMTS